MGRGVMKSQWLLALAVYVVFFSVVCLLFISHHKQWQGQHTDDDDLRGSRASLGVGGREAAEKQSLSENRTIVVIVAYIRGGSTFTGEIINSNPNIFYMFEPLHYVDHMHLKEPLWNDMRHEFLRDFFACNYSQQGSILPDFLRFMKFEKSRKLARSMAVARSLGCSKWPEKQRVEKCPIEHVTVDTMEELCQRHSIHAAKFVRVSIAHLERYVHEYSGRIKIIHLIRDPRGIANSRIRLRWHEGSSFKEMGKMCHNMLDNIQRGEKLEQKYPNTYRLVKYEDLAAGPENLGKVIYDFLGLDIPPEVSGYIKQSSHGGSGVRTEHQSYTARRDSAATADKWRSQLPVAKVREVEAACGQVMRGAGYLKR